MPVGLCIRAKPRRAFEFEFSDGSVWRFEPAAALSAPWFSSIPVTTQQQVQDWAEGWAEREVMS